MVKHIRNMGMPDLRVIICIMFCYSGMSQSLSLPSLSVLQSEQSKQECSSGIVGKPAILRALYSMTGAQVRCNHEMDS